MKFTSTLLFTALIAIAADIKPLPGQAGNDDIELVGTPILDRDGVTEAVGQDMGAGYILVRIKITPKDKTLRIGPDDFTLLCRKDGQRSTALEPGQIAGKGALIVKAAANQPGGAGTATNGPIWGGVGGIGMGSRGANPGKDAPVGVAAESGDKERGDKDPDKPREKEKDSPLLTALKVKCLPDVETKEPVEGLLYFLIDGKFKQKDLALFYKGQAGRLTMEFENPPKKK
jgi:hypothetical protein